MKPRVFLLAISLTAPAAAQEQTFKVANTTVDCKNGSSVTHQVCLPEGQAIRGVPVITVVSQSGRRANYQPGHLVPGRQNCWQFNTIVEPLGEDCFKLPPFEAVCNCKGRGWIELEVRLTPQ